MFEQISFQTDEEWREFRKQGIGGSDAGTILVVNPYESPFELWLEKTGRQEPADLSGNEKIEWGNRLESAIAQKFADLHPEYSVEETHATFVSEERPFMHANIDRQLQDLKTGALGILEVKTAGLMSEGDWVFGPPDHYIAQVTHYLAVTGYEFAYIAVLIGGQEYREYEIARDEEDISTLIDREEEFWGMVQSNTMPKVVGTDGEAKALARAFKDDDGEVPQVSDIDHPEIFECWQVCQDFKEIEARKKKLMSEVKALIGKHKGVETESMKVTWPRGSVVEYMGKDGIAALKRDHPEIFDKYKSQRIHDGGVRFSFAKE